MTKLRFRWVAAFLAVFAAAMALGWAVFPNVLAGVWGLAVDDGASRILTIRTACLYLGLSIVLWMARRQPPAPTRRAITVGTGVLCLALCVSSIATWLLGAAGLGMLLTGLFELVAGAACFVVDRMPPNTERSQQQRSARAP